MFLQAHDELVSGEELQFKMKTTAQKKKDKKDPEKQEQLLVCLDLLAFICFPCNFIYNSSLT